MSELVTLGVSPFDALRHEDERGEYWLARELMRPLGYSQWRRFADAIERARVALRTNGEDPDVHIVRLPTPANARGAATPRDDYRLSRYGVYATIQGGDPRKPEIAAGWAYFRVKTREAELAPVVRLDADLARIYELTVGMQQTRNEVKAIEHEQRRMAGELTAVAEDVADLKAISPLTTGDDMTIRDAARAVTGRTLGQNRFVDWLVDQGVAFRDHNSNVRCQQDWVRRGLATESWEEWSNHKGWSWVTRFTPRGVAKLRQMYGAA